MSEPFGTISAILRRHATGLIAEVDTADHLQLTRSAAADRKPAFVASVKIAKRYVALHLMPLYCHPELVEAMPQALRPHMHGKSCLNFKPGKPVPESDLDTLIAAAMAAGLD